MGNYILKRVLQSLLVAWAAITIMFLAFFVMPGDPVELRGGERSVSEETKAQLREQFGLDEPLPMQYLRYLGRVVRFDLGESYVDRSSVNDRLWEGVQTSARLAFWGAMCQLAISLTVGVVAAAKRASLLDRVSTIATICLQAMPVFVTGLIAQYLLGVLPFRMSWPQWARFPVQGLGPDTWVLGVVPTGHTWKYMVIPALVVSLVETAFLARLMRSSLLEILRADYLRTAAAKGLPRRAVLLRHGVRNALIPYTTQFGLSIINLFGVAVLTETTFSIAGLGSQIAQGALAQDAPVVLGLSLVVILFAALVTLAVDLAYGWLDPRVRLEVAT